MSDLVDYAHPAASVLDVVQAVFEVQPAVAFGSLEPGQLHPVQLIYCQWPLRMETTKGIDRPDVIFLCAVRSRKDSSLTVRC